MTWFDEPAIITRLGHIHLHKMFITSWFSLWKHNFVSWKLTWANLSQICTNQSNQPAKTMCDVEIIRNIELSENKLSTKRSKKNKSQAAPREKTRALCSPKARRNSAWEITPTAFIMRALNSDSSIQRQIANLRCRAFDFRCCGHIANLTPIFLNWLHRSTVVTSQK